MTKVKICGLRRPEDIDIVNRYLPDYAGFILAENRKRSITVEQLFQFGRRLDPGIRKAAVFVNQDIAYPASVFQKGLADIIQLHGQEDEAYIRELRRQAPGIRILKAFSISEASDLKRAEQSSADMILLDHGRGGTGSSFDWSVVSDMKRCFFLAGGVNPRNVRQAIAMTHPYAVDVSSGVETDGYKDEQKVKELMEAVRGEENHE